jgi:hypothetical protein
VPSWHDTFQGLPEGGADYPSLPSAGTESSLHRDLIEIRPSVSKSCLRVAKEDLRKAGDQEMNPPYGLGANSFPASSIRNLLGDPLAPGVDGVPQHSPTGGVMNRGGHDSAPGNSSRAAQI